MKIKVNTATWKKALKKALSLVGNASGNPKENCIGIIIQEDNSYLEVLESGVHNTIIKLKDIVIEEEGFCYLQYNSLKSLDSQTITLKEFEISLNNNNLIYSVEEFGAISEPIFHDQDPFQGMKFDQNNFELLEEGSTPLVKLLNTGVKSFSDTTEDKTKTVVNIILDEENSIMSGVISNSTATGLVYNFTSNSSTDFTIRTELIKNVSFLFENEESVKLEKNNNTLKITSDKGESVLQINGANKDSINYLSASFKTEADSLMLLDADKLKAIVKWQSYGNENGGCISIYSEEDKLLIKGDKTEEASSLAYEEINPFNLIKLPTELLLGAVNCIPKDVPLTLKVTTQKVANRDNLIKTGLLIYEEQDYTGTAYLSEPALLN